MDGDSTEADNDVVPPAMNQILGAAWILLFSARWICVPLMLSARLVTASLIADLDDRFLFRLYLILLAVTILIVALRLTRRTARQSGAHPLRHSNGPVGPGISKDKTSVEGKQEADSL